MSKREKPEQVPGEQSAVDELATALQEPNRFLLRKVVRHLGVQTVQGYLRETLAIEAQGGLLTADGARRRTPGGVFFHLLRAKLPPEDQQALWPWTEAQAQRRAAQAVNGRTEARPLPAAPPSSGPPLRWEERGPAVEAALKQRGEATTVKVTLIGRPGNVTAQGQCVITAMKMTGKPPAFPKGVPTPPETPMTYVVSIATKQWQKVEPFLKNPEDVLIVEGFLTYDSDLKKMSVFAITVATKLQQQATRDQPKPTPSPHAADG